MACRRIAGVAACLAAIFAGCSRHDGKPGKNGGAAGKAEDSAASAELGAFWEAWKKSVAAGDGHALWNMTCASNRRDIVDRTRASMGVLPDSEWKVLAALTGQPEARLREMPAEMLAEETTAAMLGKLREQPAERAKAEKSDLVGITVDGDRGTIRFRTPDGRELSLVALREDGGWKADIEASARNGGKK